MARHITYSAAVREGLDQAMEQDERVIVFGLDVDDPKRILGTTNELLEKYGPTRLFGTPLSEDAMTGTATSRPVTNRPSQLKKNGGPSDGVWAKPSAWWIHG